MKIKTALILCAVAATAAFIPQAWVYGALREVALMSAGAAVGLPFTLLIYRLIERAISIAAKSLPAGGRRVAMLGQSHLSSPGGERHIRR
jgi:hypothetical protein